MKITKGFYFLLAFFAIAIGLYPLKYLLMGFHFDSMDAKNNEWVASIFWDISFYTHITFGGIALLIGWVQFSKELRQNYLPIHRIIGKTYVIATLLSALGGIYIALFAMGGIIASAGFISLGLIWFYTTLKAYLDVRVKKFIEHERMMVYSYAACCAAVTLRLWLPLLELLFNDFDVAYEVVAWWCWIPNLLIANYLLSKKYPRLAYFSAWITPNHLATCLVSGHDPSAYGTFTLWIAHFHELYSPFKAHTNAKNEYAN